MKLLLDAGNTRLKWRRLADDDSLLEENSTLLADLGGFLLSGKRGLSPTP